MANKTVSSVAKGMLLGAVLGGGAAYISGMNLNSKCKCLRKKALQAYRYVCRNIK